MIHAADIKLGVTLWRIIDREGPRAVCRRVVEITARGGFRLDEPFDGESQVWRARMEYAWMHLTEGEAWAMYLDERQCARARLVKQLAGEDARIATATVALSTQSTSELP